MVWKRCEQLYNSATKKRCSGERDEEEEVEEEERSATFDALCGQYVRLKSSAPYKMLFVTRKRYLKLHE